MDIANLHRLKNALLNLQGSICGACGKKAFPARHRCDACRSTDMRQHRFQGTGELWTYSEVHAAPCEHAADSPYVIGMVRLDEGVMVLAQLTDLEPDEPRPGMRLEAVTRRIQTDGDTGLIVYGYKFRPVRGAAAA